MSESKRADALTVGDRFRDEGYAVTVVCPRGACVHAPERDRWTVHVSPDAGPGWFVAHHDDEVLTLV
jgi:putative intracellular protease/amidase